MSSLEAISLLRYWFRDDFATSGNSFSLQSVWTLFPNISALTIMMHCSRIPPDLWSGEKGLDCMPAVLTSTPSIRLGSSWCCCWSPTQPHWVTGADACWKIGKLSHSSVWPCWWLRWGSGARLLWLFVVLPHTKGAPVWLLTHQLSSLIMPNNRVAKDYCLTYSQFVCEYKLNSVSPFVSWKSAYGRNLHCKVKSYF